MADFVADISKFGAKTEDRIDDALRGIALNIFAKVVAKNPVDTGRSQNNWNIGINNVDPSVTEEAIRNAQTIIGKARQTIKKIKGGDTIYITNNVKYIRVLEDGGFSGSGPKTTSDGYSIQAPNGMVKVTLQEIPQIVRTSTSEAKRKNP